MTILDDRPVLDRLTPTTTTVVEEALQRLEAALVNLDWEVGSNADADTFKWVRNSNTRQRIIDDLDRAGDTLGAQVRKLVDTMRDEIELEMMRLA